MGDPWRRVLRRGVARSRGPTMMKGDVIWVEIGHPWPLRLASPTQDQEVAEQAESTTALSFSFRNWHCTTANRSIRTSSQVCTRVQILESADPRRR